MRYLPLIFVLILIPVSGYSFAQINEIRFTESEFIELLSTQSLNLSEAIIRKEGDSNYNTISKVKSSQSNFTLIVGQNFLEEYNTSELNCTIYATDKSQVGYRGFKTLGDPFSINLANNKSLSWNLILEDSSNSSFSLNYLESNNYYYGRITPCTANDVSTDNTENLTPIDDNNCAFNILSNKDYYDDKIEFSFFSLSDLFTIDYWVEDYFGEIVKNSVITENTNKKSFTPKETGLYRIRADYTSNNCSISDSEEVFYVNPTKEPEPEIMVEEEPEIKSTIDILNEDKIINLEEKIVEFRLYRGGDTRKSLVSVYVNNELLSKFKLDKYSSITSEQKFSTIEGENIITIIGLDIEEEIKFFNEVSIPEIEKKKDYFNLSIVNISKKVFFKYDTNFNISSGSCYVSHIRTKVTDEADIMSNNLSIELNTSKLREREHLDTYPLKLTCKYIKEGTVSDRYTSVLFNFSIPEEQINASVEVISFSSNTVNNTRKIPIEEKIYESKNSTIKQYSSIFITIALACVLLTIIIKSDK